MNDREVAKYRLRVIEQTEAWVAGQPRHNTIDDECCPDFSCCCPDLFEVDRGKRFEYLHELRLKYGYERRMDA